MNFGSKLSSARKAAGFTQPELAEKLGTSTRAIQHYEQGRSTPPLPKLHKLAAILGVSLSYFEDETESDITSEGIVTSAEQEFLRWIKENVSDMFFYEFDKSPEESKEQLMKDLRYMWEREKKLRGEK